MKNRISLMFMLILAFFAQSHSQTSYDPVRVSAYVDNKSVKAMDLKVEVNAGQIKTVSKLDNYGNLATDIFNWIGEDQNNVQLRVSFYKYELEFFDLTKGHLAGNWKISVKNPPFPVSEDIPRPETVSYVYSIEFNSGNSLGTVMSRIKYKEKAGDTYKLPLLSEKKIQAANDLIVPRCDPHFETSDAPDLIHEIKEQIRKD